MEIDDKMSQLIKAQAALTLHMAERLVMLQVAFEAFVRDRFERQTGELETHYEMRKVMLSEDMAGKTNDLLNTLRQALDQTGK